MPRRSKYAPGYREASGIEALEGLADMTATMGSSILVEPAAGLTGLGMLAYSGGDLSTAIEAIESTRRRFTREPKTAVGQKHLQDISEFMAPLEDARNWVGKKNMDAMPDWAPDWTKASAGTVGHIWPEVLGTMVGAPAALRMGKRLSKTLDKAVDTSGINKGQFRQGGSMSRKFNKAEMALAKKLGVKTIPHKIKGKEYTEVLDVNMDVNPKRLRNSRPDGDMVDIASVVDIPMLKVRPELGKGNIVSDPNVRPGTAWAQRNEGNIGVSSMDRPHSDTVKDNIVHELTHLGNDAPGYPVGGTPAMGSSIRESARSEGIVERNKLRQSKEYGAIYAKEYHKERAKALPQTSSIMADRNAQVAAQSTADHKVLGNLATRQDNIRDMSDFQAYNHLTDEWIARVAAQRANTVRTLEEAGWSQENIQKRMESNELWDPSGIRVEDTIDIYGSNSSKNMSTTNRWADENFQPNTPAIHRDQFTQGLSRNKKSGQYVGAPRGVKTPEDIRDTLDKYKGIAETGSEGRFWYEGAHDFAKDVTRNAKNKNRLAENFGITSAGTGVDPNTGFGFKATSEGALRADEFSGGIYPASRDHLKQSHNEPRAYRKSEAGNKIEPFLNSLKTRGTDQRPVHDIHDGRAFGMTETDGSVRDSGYTDAEHNWMDNMSEQATHELNANLKHGERPWTPTQLQAAVWTGQKYELAKEKAMKLKNPVARAKALKKAEDIRDGSAKHYGDFAHKSEAYAPREAITGDTSDHMRGLANQSQDVLEDYTRKAAPGRFDEMLDMPKAKSWKGTGVFGDQNNPITGSTTYLGKLSSAAQAKISGGATKDYMTQIDPSSLRAMEANEAYHGLMNVQDAMAFRMFDHNVTGKNMNAVRVNTGRKKPISKDDISEIDRRMIEEFGADNIAVSASPTGVDLLAVGENFNPIGMDKNSFFKRSQAILKDILPKAKVTKARNMAADQDSGYIFNDWGTAEKNAGQSGQNYMDAMMPGWRDPKAVRSSADQAIEKSFNRKAPKRAQKMLDTDAAFAQELGLPVGENVTNLRNAIIEGSKSPEGAMAYIQNMMRTGALPAAIGMTLLEIFNEEDQQQGLMGL